MSDKIDKNASMRLKVTRGRSTVLFTLAYFVVFALVLILGVSHEGDVPQAAWYAAVALMAGVTVTALVLTPRWILLTPESVTVERTVGSLRMAYSDIADVREAVIQPGTNVGLFALRGLFANIGWYYSRGTGLYFSYTASDRGTVLLTLRNGRKYMVSCAEPSELIEYINHHMK